MSSVAAIAATNEKKFWKRNKESWSSKDSVDNYFKMKTESEIEAWKFYFE